jgi:hypothetical protein
MKIEPARFRSTLRSKLVRPGPLDVYFGSLSGDKLSDAERCFFRRLHLSNRTYKTTAEHRLDDVNDLVATMMPRGRRLAVMDVAASSGVSSAEWSEHLRRHGIDHSMTAGDLAVEGKLMTIGQSAAMLWQDDGHPLVLQVGRYSLYLDRSGFMRFLATSLRPPLRATYSVARRLPSATYEANPRKWRVRVRDVGLVSRRVAANGDIRVIRDDIMESGRFHEQFDVCRAANILIRTYFTDEVLRGIAQNVLARLRDGGLLIVCRTVNETNGERVNLTTVLRKRDSALEVIGRLNGGCDVEDLVSAVREPASAYTE